MRASTAYTLSRLVPAAILGTWVAVAAPAPASPTTADARVSAPSPPQAQRDD